MTWHDRRFCGFVCPQTMIYLVCIRCLRAAQKQINWRLNNIRRPCTMQPNFLFSTLVLDKWWAVGGGGGGRGGNGDKCLYWAPNYAKTADGATDAGGDQDSGSSLPRRKDQRQKWKHASEYFEDFGRKGHFLVGYENNFVVDIFSRDCLINVYEEWLFLVCLFFQHSLFDAKQVVMLFYVSDGKEVQVGGFGDWRLSSTPRHLSRGLDEQKTVLDIICLSLGGLPVSAINNQRTGLRLKSRGNWGWR